jgi:LacI family transcriptional regulator
VPDEVGGASRAIEHLLAVGRRRIAHVTGPEHHHSAQVRAAAAGARLADDGLDFAVPPLFGEWSEQWGRQAVSLLLASGTTFDAVFCGSDQIARGVADALQDVGMRIPDDAALVGFDNWGVMALACRPPLTSVDMDLEGIGRAAANLLLAAINGEPAPGRHTHPCRLVVRESTAAPPGPAPRSS